MKKNLFFALFFLLIPIYTDPRSAFAQSPTYREQELIVTYKQNVRASVPFAHAQSLLPSHKIGPTAYRVTLPASLSVPDAIKLYEQNPDVVSAEPNYFFHASATPTDPNYASQAYLPALQLPAAWDKTVGSSSVIIAIIDGGIDMDHPEFTNKLVTGYDFIDGDSDPDTAPNGIDDDDDGLIDGEKDHGTNVAGIAAAVTNNGNFGAGTCWNCKIMPIRALDDEGNGDLSTIAAAIDFAVTHKAHIINLSLVGNYSTTLGAAIDRAYAAGALVVAAAGNEGVNLDASPRSPVSNNGDAAGANKVLGVASVNTDGRRSSFSNYGNSAVDIAAPGESVLNAGYGSTTATMSGTSMSAPMIAGIAGLLKSAYPALTPAQLIAKIRLSATASSSVGIGAGLANTSAALTPNPIITAPGSGASGAIKSFSLRGATDRLTEISTNGASIAAGDIDADGEDEIIAGADAGHAPLLGLFERDGTPRQISFYPFDTRFRGGLSVAAGDVDGDGKDEIGVAQASGGQAWIKVMRSNAQHTLLAYFNAFGSAEVGASLAFGDIDRDGKDELIVGAGPGGGPQIRVYDIGTTAISGSATGATLKPISFYAFSSKSRSGISVAAGDLDGDGKDEIIASLLTGEEAWVKAYRYNTDKTVVASFRAYAAGLTCGARVAAGDVTGDGKADILTAPDRGCAPQIRSFSGAGTPLGLQFYAYPSTQRTGARITIARH